ncbi:unnamed protein product, partial [Gulo gulo]
METHLMVLVWTSLHCLALLPVGLFPDPSLLLPASPL